MRGEVAGAGRGGGVEQPDVVKEGKRRRLVGLTLEKDGNVKMRAGGLRTR